MILEKLISLMKKTEFLSHPTHINEFLMKTNMKDKLLKLFKEYCHDFRIGKNLLNKVLIIKKINE
jgi:hypothetical protein